VMSAPGVITWLHGIQRGTTRRSSANPSGNRYMVRLDGETKFEADHFDSLVRAVLLANGDDSKLRITEATPRLIYNESFDSTQIRVAINRAIFVLRSGQLRS